MVVSDTWGYGAEKGKFYMNVILNEVKNLSYLCGREMLRYHSA